MSKTCEKLAQNHNGYSQEEMFGEYVRLLDQSSINLWCFSLFPHLFTFQSFIYFCCIYSSHSNFLYYAAFTLFVLQTYFKL